MGITAVIVDDQASFRAAARALLERQGLSVIGEAADGASAIAEVRRLRPHLVLLDIQLPDMNGFQVAEHLAQEPIAPSVVLTSTRDREDYGPLLRSTSALGFIPKAELSAAGILQLATRP